MKSSKYTKSSKSSSSNNSSNNLSNDDDDEYFVIDGSLNKSENILIFHCKNIKCCFNLNNSNFNIILYSNFTIINEYSQTKDIGFVVPVDYLSFIKTVNIKYDLNSDIDGIFRFQDQSKELLSANDNSISLKGHFIKYINDLKVKGFKNYKIYKELINSF